MTDEKPVQGNKPPEAKMVPETDLIAYKKSSEARVNKVREELANTKAELANLQSEAQIRNLNDEDEEEISKVKQYLLDESKRLEKEKSRLESDVSSFREREREFRAKEIAEEYGVDIESIKGEEDMEKAAMRLALQAKRQAEKEEKVSEPVYESSPGGKPYKRISDMDNAEFLTLRKQLKKEALSKK